MNKKYIIRKNEDIEFILKNGKKIISKFFIIYYIESEFSYNMYCISVSKKLGKAHIRNLLKRRIKDILMKNKIDLNRKYVIILRKEILNISYNDMKDVLMHQIKGERWWR